MSNIGKQIAVLGVVCCCAAILLVWVASRQPATEVERSPSTQPRAGTALPAATGKGSSGQSEAGDTIATVGEHGAGDTNAASSRIIRLIPGQVLAIVNGVNITLGDLVPLSKDDPFTDRSMTEEVFDERLARAIERELTFQVAAAQHVSLTAAQNKQLSQITERYAEMMNRPDVVKTYLTEEQIAFEVRDSTARLLQVNLLAQHTGVTPYVSPDQVEQYYASHKSEYGELPADPTERDAAWAKIDLAIRQQLAPLRKQEFVQERTKYLGKLKSSAAITINQPS